MPQCAKDQGSRSPIADYRRPELGKNGGILTDVDTSDYQTATTRAAIATVVAAIATIAAALVALATLAAAPAAIASIAAAATTIAAVALR